MYKGLTSREAGELLRKFGLNQIEERKGSNLFNKFIEQISSFLMILLIGAAVISFFIGETLDGSLILLIIFLNGAFGVYQEFKAEEAVAALKKMTIRTIRVLRDSAEYEIDSRYLVPGDFFIIEEGVKLPADAEIVETIHLEMNEAALTGESIPIVKAKGEQICMGTIVSKGRAVAKVTATGMSTKFGQIAAKLSSVQEPMTPLQLKLNHLTEIIGLVGIVLSLAVFLLSSFQGTGYFSSFLLAISLAVALVPESLPAVMTVILSIGVKHMATRKAIIRKLGAIEALGSITLIATDKTGTLTTNDMEVKEVWFNNRFHSTSSLQLQSKTNISNTLRMILLNGIVCSTASLVRVSQGKSNNFEVLGDPTEGSLLKLAQKLRYDPSEVRSNWHLEDEIPFDSIKKRMTVIARDGEHRAFSKGAPESILEISTKILVEGKELKLTEDIKQEIFNVLKKWAAQGLRVLAFSYKTRENPSNVEQNNVFLGMTAIHDPPRVEAKEALERANSAGIKVVMITGDNPQTAEAIGTSIGLLQKGEAILTGDQVEAYTDEELLALLPHTKIFARVSPFHKSRIVSLYQHLGEVVGVTGDGVNDSIALKQSDVGIAMGRIGTDVARETADMVITDDNFATIVNAVEEGRNIVKRLKSSIRYLLTGNLSEAVALITGLVVGLPAIFLPLQLLYINLISDGIPALTLAFTPKDERVMKEKPHSEMELLNAQSIKYIVSIGFTVGLIVVCAFAFRMNGDIKQVRTAAFSIMAMIQTFIFVDIWFSHKSGRHTMKEFMSGLFILTVMMPFLAQYVIVSIPQVAHLFEILPIPYTEYFLYAGISAAALIVIQVVKKIFRMT